MKKTAFLVGLFALVFASQAMAIGYDNQIISDRNKLWNPLTGFAPWESVPVGYGVAHPAAPVANTAATVDVRARPLVHYTRGANIDRDLLWNPLKGQAPWCESAACLNCTENHDHHHHH